MGTCFRYPDVGIYKHQKLFFTSLTQALYKMETAAVLCGGGGGQYWMPELQIHKLQNHPGIPLLNRRILADLGNIFLSITGKSWK